MFQSIRGTHDILPVEARYLSEVERHAYKLARRWGFKEIRTPMFERADLFVRGLGVMAGLVERELWTFHDKHGQKLALRADMTACVVRAYQQHELQRQFHDLTKLFYVAPVFLLGKDGEQPSRQVQQFGVEVIGTDSPAVDVELLCIALDFCRGLELDDASIELNSLGCEKCRPAYYDALREFFSSRQNDLCNTCKRKFRPHPAWTLSCPEESCTTLANLSPTILGYLCGDCKNHFNHVKHLIKALDLDVTFNPRVVRDIEYYNRTCFRIVVRDHVIGYGGRFDGLVQRFGGADTPAAGFAVNLDEVVELFAEVATYEIDELDAVFIPEGPESTRILLPTVQRLRQAGARVEILYRDTENRPDSRWVVRLDEADALRGAVEVTSTNSGRVEQISQERIYSYLHRLLGFEVEETDEGDKRHRRRLLQRSRREQPQPQPREPKRDGSREWSKREQPAAEEATEHSEEGLDAVETSLETGEEGTARRRRRRRRNRGGEEAATASAENIEAAEEERRPEQPQRREERPRNRDERRPRGEAEAPPREREGAEEPRERDRERPRDRGRDRDRDRDRAERPERGNERPERGNERGNERPERGNERPERGNERGYERPERGNESEPREGGEDRPREDRGRRDRPTAPPKVAAREDQGGKTFVPAFSLGMPAGKPPIFSAAPAAARPAATGLPVMPGALPAAEPAASGAPRWSVIPLGGGLGVSATERDDENEPSQSEALAQRSFRGRGPNNHRRRR